MLREFLVGLQIGILVSIPLGPMGLLVVQRTLSKGRRYGFVSGVGAALSDAVYATLAAFGMSLVEDFMKRNQLVMLILVGLLLFGFGLHTFRNNPVKQLRQRNDKPGRLWSDFVTTFMLTFSNPLTLVVLLAVFAKMNISHEGGNISTSLLIGGLFLGACLWWFILTFIVGIFKKFVNIRNLWWVNKIAGSIIMIIGVYILVAGILQHFQV